MIPAILPVDDAPENIAVLKYLLQEQHALRPAIICEVAENQRIGLAEV